MADKKKKASISQFGLAQKAIQTSSASTRFQASDDPGEKEIRDYLGSPASVGEIEEYFKNLRTTLGGRGGPSPETDRQIKEVLESEMAAIQNALLVGVPEHRQTEVLEKFWGSERKRIERIRGLETGAQEAVKKGQRAEAQVKEGPAAYSPYATQDRIASELRNTLAQTSNAAAEEAYLFRGGATQLAGDDPHQITRPVDEQLIRAEDDRRYGSLVGRLSDRLGLPPEEIERRLKQAGRRKPEVLRALKETAEETPISIPEIHQDKVVLDKGQREEVQRLLARKAELDRLERNSKKGQQRLTAEPPPHQEVVPDFESMASVFTPVIPKQPKRRSLKEIRATDARLKPGDLSTDDMSKDILRQNPQRLGGESQSVNRPQEIGPAKPPVSMSKLGEKLRKEREQVNRELSRIRGRAIIGSAEVTPEETERRVRENLGSAISQTSDPLERARRGWGFIDRDEPGEDIPREPLKVSDVAKKDQIEAYVHHRVQSFHAPTHALRIDAKRKSDRLAGIIAQQTQEVVGKKELKRRMDRVKEELGIPVRKPSLPHPLETYEGRRNATREGFVKLLQITINDPEARQEIKDRYAELLKNPKEIDSYVDRAMSGAPTLEGARYARDQVAVMNRERVLEEREKERKRRATRLEFYKDNPPPGRPPGGPPSPGDIDWEPPERPITDPRLNTFTVEDIYDRYGHERIAPRLGWEKKRLTSKLFGTPLPESKPKPFEAVTAQGKFLRDQAQNRAKAFKDGTDILGFNADRERIAFPGKGARTEIGTTPKARIGVTPNIMYEYTLRNPSAETEEAIRRQERYHELMDEWKNLKQKTAAATDKDKVKLQKKLDTLEQRIITRKKYVDELVGPVTQRVYPTDTRTKFEEGEILEQPTILPQQEQTFKFRQGLRNLREGKEPVPDSVDEIRYIPTPGGKGETLTLPHPEGKEKTVYEIQAAEGSLISRGGGQWQPITSREYEEAQIERENWRNRGRIGSAPPQVRQRAVPRKIQYKYVERSATSLRPNQRDIATVKVPRIGPFQERLVPLQFEQPNEPWTPVHYLLSGETPENRWGLLGELPRAHAEQQKLEAAWKIAGAEPGTYPDLEEQHGIRGHEEAKILASAAMSAGFYSAKNRLTKGTAPSKFNKFLPKGMIGLPVKKAYVEPSLAKAAQLREMLVHPITSMSTGEGVGVSSIKYRQELIDQDLFARRMMERDLNRLKNIQRTQKFVQEHQAKRGPVGAFTRWRLSALQKSPDYKPWEGGIAPEGSIFAEAATRAHDIDETRSLEFWREKTGEKEILRDLNPLTQERARKNLFEYRNIENRAKNWTANFKPAPESLLSHTAQRNLLIGGAVVGTAVGAAYLYHRHQENKKPQEDRIAFYNKILPPSFETPKVFPKSRVTGTVKFGDRQALKELGLAGKELPMSVGVSLHRKRVTMRPSERGYEPNLSLIGRPSFRGTSGGSARKGLIYHNTDLSRPGRRSNIKAATHEVYVRGHKLPGRLNVDKLRDTKRVGTNPRAMSSAEMDNIIWAFQGHPLEEQTKNFYRGMGGNRASNLVERWEDPDEVDRIRRQKGRQSKAYKQESRAAMRERRRTYGARGVV